MYNGLNHLKNRNFAEFMIREFDLWVVVEGHAKPGGSTSWCNDLRLPVRSTDGSHELMGELSTRKNVLYYSPGRFWQSKDEQVNKAIAMLRSRTESCLLWQVDCDEVWTSENLKQNERVLTQSRATCGRVQFKHIVGQYQGDLLVAKGKWGSGMVNRLWKWKGEDFYTHEPAQLHGQSRVISLPKKFDHYSLYFAEDVKFKSKYYKGYEDLYTNWIEMQKGPFPCPVSKLIGVYGSRTSKIHRELQGS